MGTGILGDQRIDALDRRTDHGAGLLSDQIAQVIIDVLQFAMFSR